MAAKYELIDCKPVPRALAAELRAIKADAGATLTSCLRTQDAVDFARRHGCQVSSQAELVELAKHGGNPANPVGTSTHEQRSDGVAYAGPVGRRLFYWQVGTDWGTREAAKRIVAAASKRGWTATITYPNSPREGHHVNFRKKPVLNIVPTLRRGKKNRWVGQLRKDLYFIHNPHSGERYFELNEGTTFTSQLENAVVRFQRDHGQKADGIVGVQTRRQITVAKRREHARRERDPRWWEKLK